MDQLAEQEREKYQLMWSRDEYRISSPGERMVDYMLEILPVMPNDSIIDYGCGTGRAVYRFMSYGYPTVGVDIAKNAIDLTSDYTIDFVNANLWQLPVYLTSNWCYCTDVLEHIPPEKIDDVLKGIFKRTRKGGFFTISHQPDKMGELIGETLHLTVKPWRWWMDKIKHNANLFIGHAGRKQFSINRISIEGGDQQSVFYFRFDGRV